MQYLRGKDTNTMEAKFKSLSVFDFQERFPDDEKCYEYLAGLKWGSGYSCPKCGNKGHSRGVKPHDRQCTSCNYLESPTAGTLFHKVKFPLLKAFYIVYYVATGKKGVTSTELSRKLELRQKTCWFFKRKVMEAMKSSKSILMTGKVDVDETYVGGQDDTVIGRNEGKKKIVAVAVEKKGKGVSRMYARTIATASKKNLKAFMKDFVEAGANVRTDKWSGYSGLEKDFPNLIREKSEKKGKNFKELHRCIMMFKAWLRGMHHSVRDLQPYLDEYTYRFNRHKMKEGIFENLMVRMVKAKPFPYKLMAIS
jgi:hypothetical protein